jgi:hypothetical protein
MNSFSTNLCYFNDICKIVIYMAFYIWISGTNIDSDIFVRCRSVYIVRVSFILCAHLLVKMHLLVLFFLIVGCWCDIKVSVDEKGGYKITINDNIWLRSSRTALYVDNKWYSSDENSLPLTSISSAQGYDPLLGSWSETQLNYDLGRSATHTKIVGHIREWHAFSAITFHLDTGDQVLTNTVPLDIKHVRTVFPSFNIEQIDSNDQRGYFTYEGKVNFGNVFKVSFVFFFQQVKWPVMIINMQAIGTDQPKSSTRVCSLVRLLFSISRNVVKVIS